MWAGALAYPLAWVRAVVLICALAMLALTILFLLFVGILQDAIDESKKLFNEWLIFLIVVVTSWLGLGWLVYQIFSVFGKL